MLNASGNTRGRKVSSTTRRTDVVPVRQGSTDACSSSAAVKEGVSLPDAAVDDLQGPVDKPAVDENKVDAPTTRSSRLIKAEVDVLPTSRKRGLSAVDTLPASNRRRVDSTNITDDVLTPAQTSNKYAAYSTNVTEDSPTSQNPATSSAIVIEDGGTQPAPESPQKSATHSTNVTKDVLTPPIPPKLSSTPRAPPTSTPAVPPPAPPPPAAPPAPREVKDDDLSSSSDSEFEEQEQLVLLNLQGVVQSQLTQQDLASFKLLGAHTSRPVLQVCGVGCWEEEKNIRVWDMVLREKGVWCVADI